MGPRQEARNLEKHGISFVAAARVLSSGTILESQSERSDEARWVAVGVHPTSQKVVAVVYTVREGRYRIISARRARENEEAEYRTRIESRSSEADL